jgi:hypothetical protein
MTETITFPLGRIAGIEYFWAGAATSHPGLYYRDVRGLGRGPLVRVPLPSDILQAEILARAIHKNLGGCEAAEGRWVDESGCSLEVYEKGTVPEGCFDVRSPPKEDAIEDMPPFPDDLSPAAQAIARCVGSKWLMPATWDPYSAEEQSNWMKGVAADLRSALAEAGMAEPPLYAADPL